MPYREFSKMFFSDVILEQPNEEEITIPDFTSHRTLFDEENGLTLFFNEDGRCTGGICQGWDREYLERCIGLQFNCFELEDTNMIIE